MPSLADAIREHVCAAFTGLWVTTLEPDDAETEILRMARAQDWRITTWDCDRGLSGDPTATDPLAVIKSMPTLAVEDGTSLLVVRNLHRFLGGVDLIQAIDTQLAEGKQRRTFLIVLAPVVELPVELTRSFVLLEHDLPDRAQLGAIAQNLEEGAAPEGEALDQLLTAAAGLTRCEAEGAFALSIVRHGNIEPGEVWEIKSAALKKSGLMSLHRGEETFADLGGLDSLKAFCSSALRAGERKAKPKGVLLLGVPGAGKSAFAKALGNESGRPTLTLDLGALMGSLVGQTEERTRQALKIADAMAPCVLYCDELDRQFATGTGATDSGVGQRILQSFLTWLNDHTSEVFFVGTSNDIQSLPSAFTRAERWDGVFFVDFPTLPQRLAIWNQYQRYYDLEAQALPSCNDWTGAEIKTCCRLASLLGVSLIDASRNVVPIAHTAGETVQRLRTWAHGRCLDASRPGLYQSTAPPAPKAEGEPRRQIERLDPGLN